MIKEASVEEKIRMRKKRKARDRAEKARRREQGQPRKRMRMEKGLDMIDEKEEENKEMKTSPAKKRKVTVIEKGISAKRQRGNMDMDIKLRKKTKETSKEKTKETSKEKNNTNTAWQIIEKWQEGKRKRLSRATNCQGGADWTLPWQSLCLQEYLKLTC